ncbi:hypothetical protein [Gemmobacter denitrificans]|uniref:Glyceraldehyde-3-phosphate dehydrogenase n=1 Tax=Gemmobacter denitrificans TaxID=3123040 RepID=A0ABU8BPY9_9RHOB
MSDRIAFALGLIICALIALDVLANGGDALLFLARKLQDLTEYLIFWR